MCFVRVHVVHPYCSIDTQKEQIPFFILSERSDFHNINDLSIAVYTFTWCMLTALSVEEIVLPMYVNLCTNFRGQTTKSGDGFLTFKTHELNFICFHEVANAYCSNRYSTWVYVVL